MDIHAFMAAVAAQDAQGMRRFLHPEAQIHWHNSNECFTAEEYIRANCEYPGSWLGQVERLEQAGDLSIAVTHIWAPEGSPSFRSISFIRVQDDRIIALDEYWSEDGPPPAWRQAIGIGRAIRE